MTARPLTIPTKISSKGEKTKIRVVTLSRLLLTLTHEGEPVAINRLAEKVGVRGIADKVIIRNGF